MKNRSTVAVIFLSFAIFSSFLWRGGGRGGKRGVPDSGFREQFYIHQGIRDKLKQSSFNAYGLLYQSFVVKKGDSLSLIMRNYNLMKIPFVCVMFVFDPYLVVFIKGTFPSCLI